MERRTRRQGPQTGAGERRCGTVTARCHLSRRQGASQSPSRGGTGGSRDRCGAEEVTAVARPSGRRGRRRLPLVLLSPWRRAPGLLLRRGSVLLAILGAALVLAVTSAATPLF